MTNSRTLIDIDFGMLERLEFLDPNGESGLMTSLVTLYIESIPESVARLREAVKSGTPQQLSKAAHALKSGHANLGVKQIVVILQKIEDLKVERGELDGFITEIEQMSIQAGDQLKQYLQQKR